MFYFDNFRQFNTSPIEGVEVEFSQNAALRRKSKDWSAWNKDNVSEWGDMSIHGLVFQLTSTIKIQLSVQTF
jgi:hypothetical protein